MEILQLKLNTGNINAIIGAETSKDIKEVINILSILENKSKEFIDFCVNVKKSLYEGNATYVRQDHYIGITTKGEIVVKSLKAGAEPPKTSTLFLIKVNRGSEFYKDDLMKNPKEYFSKEKLEKLYNEADSESYLPEEFWEFYYNFYYDDYKFLEKSMWLYFCGTTYREKIENRVKELIKFKENLSNTRAD